MKEARARRVSSPRSLVRRLLLSPIAFLLACAGPPEAAVEPCSTCLLTDANNYTYSSELAIGTLEVPEQADVLVRWESLTRDIRGAAYDPATDVDEAKLIGFRDMAPDEVAYALAHDELAQADAGAYVTCAPTDGGCLLSEFGMFGNTLDIQQYFTEGYGTWLLALGPKGTTGADALAFLTPRAGASAIEVALTDTTSRLDVEVDLASLAPVAVEPFEPVLVLDWSGLTRDGLGDPLDTDTVDELWVGRFFESRAELEARMFELETLAGLSWTVDVSGRSSVEMASLVGETAFMGIDRSGTWVAALRCRTCTNPAPRVLTFLTPASE